MLSGEEWQYFTYVGLVLIGVRANSASGVEFQGPLAWRVQKIYNASKIRYLEINARIAAKLSARSSGNSTSYCRTWPKLANGLWNFHYELERNTKCCHLTSARFMKLSVAVGTLLLPISS